MRHAARGRQQRAMIARQQRADPPEIDESGPGLGSGGESVRLRLLQIAEIEREIGRALDQPQKDRILHRRQGVQPRHHRDRLRQGWIAEDSQRERPPDRHAPAVGIAEGVGDPCGIRTKMGRPVKAAGGVKIRSIHVRSTCHARAAAASRVVADRRPSSPPAR